MLVWCAAQSSCFVGEHLAQGRPAIGQNLARTRESRHMASKAIHRLHTYAANTEENVTPWVPRLPPALLEKVLKPQEKKTCCGLEELTVRDTVVVRKMWRKCSRHVLSRFASPERRSDPYRPAYPVTSKTHAAKYPHVVGASNRAREL